MSCLNTTVDLSPQGKYFFKLQFHCQQKEPFSQMWNHLYKSRPTPGLKLTQCQYSTYTLLGCCDPALVYLCIAIWSLDEENSLWVIFYPESWVNLTQSWDPILSFNPGYFLPYFSSKLKSKLLYLCQLSVWRNGYEVLFLQLFLLQNSPTKSL